MKILVTGGLGFIGSNLVPELRRRGHEVWVCDLTHSEGPNYVRGDISKYRQLERIFNEHQFDCVYHLAAEYGRWNGEDYYENLWLTNVVGTKNMLRLQEQKRFRMIFFSSAEVYGDYDGVMSEDVMDKVPIKQMNDYAMTKWVGELEALRNEPYTVYLGHKRIFDYVEDTCRTFANIVDNFKPGEVYNVGGKEEWEHEIKYISDLILKYLGKDDSGIIYKEAEPFTTKVKHMDFSKARRDLNHDPRVSVEEGIPRTIEWMKKVYGFK